VGEEGGKSSALTYAITLAEAWQAVLSIHVFPAQMQQPLPIHADTSPRWIAEETERLRKLSAAAIRLAKEAAERAGIDIIAAHPALPLEFSSERFVQLGRVHDVTIVDAAEAAD